MELNRRYVVFGLLILTASAICAEPPITDSRHSTTDSRHSTTDYSQSTTDYSNPSPTTDYGNNSTATSVDGPSRPLKQVRLLRLLPITNFYGRACLAPLDMMIDEVNARDDILDGYQLSYDLRDSSCNAAGIAVYTMLEALSSHTYTMILGPPCSMSAQATSTVSYMWNLTQLSAGGTSPDLSDRTRFPKFYRMGLPDYKYNGARVGLLKRFNWKKVATIHQAIEFFSTITNDFITEVRAHNISIITQEIFMQDPMTRVQNLQSHDARIIYVALYRPEAMRLLCDAYKIGFYGPKIVWMFPGWYPVEFWKNNLNEWHIDCTPEEMTSAIEGAFTFGPIYRNPVEERGVANCTAKEFDIRHHQHRNYDARFKAFEFMSGRCYDQAWVTALALNCTVQRLQEMGHPKTLDQFSYNDSDINEIIFECMGDTSLIGITGRLSFQTADPDTIVKVTRIQDGVQELIAFYRQDKRPRVYEWIEGALRWKDGKIPRDSTHVSYEETFIPGELYVSLCLCSGLGIAMACGFLAFNIAFRQNRTVKMSSPNINNILLLGCVISYMSVWFKPTGTGNAALCVGKVFTFALGFTLTIGSLFSKTWRVHRRFTKDTSEQSSVQDIQLLSIIGLIVTVILTIVIVWESIEPHAMVVSYIKGEVYTIGNDMEVRPFVRMCHSSYSFYFGWAIYAVEGTFLAFGAFLAWETRNVKMGGLNDSRQYGMCVYNAVIISIVGLVLSLLLDQQVVMSYGAISTCVILGTTLTQLIIFIPKVYSVYRGEEIGSEDTAATAMSVNTDTAC